MDYEKQFLKILLLQIMSYVGIGDDEDQKMTINEKIANEMAGNYSSGLDKVGYTQSGIVFCDTVVCLKNR